MKGRYFGIVFGDGIISIKVLQSVQEYWEEGEALHHCVSSYALRKDSLILSARINEQRIETVEISLKSYEVVQCRGLQNKNTEYHERILNLVRENMHLVRRCKTRRKQESKLKAIAV